MGDDLHRGAEIFSLPLLVQNVPIDLSCGQVGVFVQVFVDESFIMPQIQVGFRTVLGHIHLAMLIGAHGARVNIDIGIQLLRGDLQTSGFQQPPQGSGGDPFAKAGDHTAGHKYIFRHILASTVRFLQNRWIFYREKYTLTPIPPLPGAWR